MSGRFEAVAISRKGIPVTSTLIAPPSPDTGALRSLQAIGEHLQRLTGARWSEEAPEDAKEAVVALEQIARITSAIRADVLAEIERTGTWSHDGQRTIQAWMSERTGSSRNTAFKNVGLSKSLNDDLPQTRAALAGGLISEDHAQILARECTKTDSHRTRLSDPRRGESYLLRQAAEMDATKFAKVAKGWAIETDPKAADRAWRSDASKEDLMVTAKDDGYRISGWLTPAHGALLTQALASHMGRKSADDTRSLPQRQAAALMSMAHQGLNGGLQLPNSRIRPQLTITVDYATFAGLVDATGPSAPAAALGSEHPPHPAQWARDWQPGEDHAISARLDYSKLRGLPPATLADGTPLPPALLARLACSSLLSRVIFGPASTVLDSGREERIFTASQTRAIIARDRHCQYPGCDEEPNRSEVHHSLEWFKHNGSTHVDLGILLCWHHHSMVHERAITITRTGGKWQFTTKNGRDILPPGPSPGRHVPTPAPTPQPHTDPSRRPGRRKSSTDSWPPGGRLPRRQWRQQDLLALPGPPT